MSKDPDGKSLLLELVMMKAQLTYIQVHVGQNTEFRQTLRPHSFYLGVSPPSYEAFEKY